MRESLRRFFQRHPSVAVLSSLALLSSVIGLDVSRIMRMHDVATASTWSAGVVLGLALTGMCIVCVYVLWRGTFPIWPKIFGGLAWLAAFGWTHPRRSSGVISSSLDLALLITVDLTLLLGAVALCVRRLLNGCHVRT